MTFLEAEAIMKRVGCLDLRNVACLHIAYCHYSDRAGRGECERLPVSEAYRLLCDALKKPAPEAKQEALFDASPLAL